MSLLMSAAAFATTYGLRDTWVQLSPFVLFYVAVALSSWYGGLGPGLLAVAAGAAAAAASFLLGPHGGPWDNPSEAIARLVLFAAVGVLIASLNGALHRALAERKRAEAQVRRNHEHLRTIGAELMIAEERERRRIATVLHDSVVQLLALAKLKVDAARRAAPAEGASRLSEVYDLVDQAIAQARTLTADISPPVLYELGLGPAIQWLGDRMRADHGLGFELAWDRQPIPLTEEARIVLFQAVRELMVNVVKHARASTCRTTIARDAEGRALTIAVEDDGCGFPAGAADATAADAAAAPSPDYSKGGFGLFNIRQRLARLGGSVLIAARTGAEGGGTAVRLTLPLAGEGPT